MFNNILVPIDGSPTSFKAVDMAISLSQKYASKVTLIYVTVSPLTGMPPELMVVPQQIMDDIEREGQEVLQKAEKAFKDNGVNDIKTLLVRGNPADKILEQAEEGHDLIVIGSRGLGDFQRFILGSVSSRVTHHAKCSVLVAH